MSVGVALIIAVALLVANAFFVAVEFALIATQRSQLSELAQKGNRRARTALNAITDLNTQIAGAQLGITIATIALGSVAEPSVAHLLETTALKALSLEARHVTALIIALSLVTFLHVLLSEMVPKNIALADPPRIAMLLAPAHSWFVRFAAPLIWLLNAAANSIVRAIGLRAVNERGEAKSPEELAILFNEAHHDQVLAENDLTLLSNTLDLGELTIADAAVPWAQVATVEASATIAEIETSMATSGHSRLVLVDSTEAPVGWVHAKDLLSADASMWSEALPAAKLRELTTFSSSATVETGLEHMRAARQHLGLVVEGDVPAGIVTLEDLLAILVSDLDPEPSRPESQKPA